MKDNIQNNLKLNQDLPDEATRTSFFDKLWSKFFKSDVDKSAFQEKSFNFKNLSDLRLDDIAVPKADIIALPEDSSIEEIVQIFRSSRLSRFPIFRETLDNPQGLLHLKDFALGNGFGGKSDFNLKSMLRPLIFAPPSMTVGTLLQKMQAERIHMALIIDEYGGVEGLVTFEDLLEEIVGDIVDEHDEEEDQLWIEEKKDIFLVSARLDLDLFQEQAGVDLRRDIDDGDEYETIGGLVYYLASRIPVRGEVIKDKNGHEYNIVDADARQIKRLRVQLSADYKRNLTAK